MPGEFACTNFGERFRHLRVALKSKQSALSASGLRCTDAAISHWERGKRLPSARMIGKVIDAFLELGASPFDVAELQAAWAAERSTRHGSLPGEARSSDIDTPI